MSKKKICRPVVRIDTRAQWGLFEGDAPPSGVPRARRVAPICFEDPDPREIRIGALPLDAHLRQMGLRDALVVRELLAERDWSAFEAHYSAEGRPGYAPWLMAGIVLFGLLRGVSSLRALERFARSDLECLWVSGGITPDHSVLGRFVQRHERELSQDLFASVSAAALERTKSNTQRLAGDGTTLEAMSSRFALLKREALQAQRERLREADIEANEHLERAAQVLAQRPTAKAIVVAEPEAGLLKLKNGRGNRPAYQTAVLANEARVVVAAEVHATSEPAALLPLLAALQGEETRELLLDAGFNTFEVIETTLAREISVLCPEQSEHVARAAGESKRIPAREFRYVTEGDYYVCPTGELLRACRRSHGNEEQGKRPYVQYATPACGGCARRGECTRGEGRTIQRSVGQELKDLLREVVMAHPQAKRIFARRKAMVEPVFASLRERQGLNRFRRRGLRGVRLELRLHVMAYNIGRVLAYAKRRAIGQGFIGLRATLKALLGELLGETVRRRPHAGAVPIVLEWAPAVEGA